MRRTVPLILLFMAFMLVIPKVGATDADHNFDDMAENGHIMNNGGVYTRDSAQQHIMVGYANGPIQRGYLEFNITGIQNTTITEIVFYYDGTVYKKDCEITLLTVRPSVTADNTLYWDIGNGTVIASEPGFPVVGDQQSITLSAAAVTSLTNALTAGQPWWSIGIISTNETGPGMDIRSYFGSSENPTANPIPTLQVTYLGNYSYTFTGGYYENSTSYGAVDVMYTTPTDDGEFTVNGSTTKQYAVEPELFYWDIDGGLARYIYSFGSENFTVLMPDDTFYTYGFTIKDYTGKSGIGDAYLEAWRAFGAETLVERMKIIQPNPTPLNLVYGRTYHIQILWADGSRYDWGYFLAGSDTSNTILARSTTFTDQAHMIYQTIRVEATRSGGTITVDYNDTRDNTVWANVTITQRGGGVMLQATRNNSTYTLNWASANASLGYIVAVTGEHGDYGEWGYVMTFDPTETFPATPSLTGIFDVGLGVNLGGWVITVAAMLGFSKTLKTRALLVGSAVATLLNYIGFASWTTNQLIFAWFFSIVVALAGGSE